MWDRLVKIDLFNIKLYILRNILTVTKYVTKYMTKYIDVTKYVTKYIDILPITLENLTKIFLRFMTLWWFLQTVTNMPVELGTNWGGWTLVQPTPENFAQPALRAYFAFIFSKNRHEIINGIGLIQKFIRINSKPSTVKPVCNDHISNKIYYLWFIQ